MFERSENLDTFSIQLYLFLNSDNVMINTHRQHNNEKFKTLRSVGPSGLTRSSLEFSEK